SSIGKHSLSPRRASNTASYLSAFFAFCCSFCFFVSLRFCTKGSKDSKQRKRTAKNAFLLLKIGLQISCLLQDMVLLDTVVDTHSDCELNAFGLRFSSCLVPTPAVKESVVWRARWRGFQRTPFATFLAFSVEASFCTVGVFANCGNKSLKNVMKLSGDRSA